MTNDIASNILIDESKAAWVRRGIENQNGICDVYLHTIGGDVPVALGSWNAPYQIISSLAISDSDANFIRDTINELDNVLDLDFEFSTDYGKALEEGTDIDIYYDTVIELNYSDALGLCDPNYYGGWYWQELFIAPYSIEAVYSSEAIRYAFLHEFGHALGLEHTFNHSDGDSLYPDFEVAFPEDTVMAYGQPASGVWPDSYTDNDWRALIEIWGEEDDNITVLTGGGQQMKGDQFLAIADTFSGTNKDDRLLGYGGPDSLTGAAGNDFIHGHWGRDNITGGIGNDELRGGDGGDTIYGGNGADVIWGGGHKNTLDAGINDSSVDQLFVHADASLYNLPRDGSYADALVGIGYEDQIFIHGVDDSALSFGVASMPNDPSQTGIGIYANGVLEATVNGNFTAEQVNAMTTGGFF